MLCFCVVICYGLFGGEKGSVREGCDSYKMVLGVFSRF